MDAKRRELPAARVGEDVTGADHRQALAHHMIATELRREMHEVLSAVEECEMFPERKFSSSEKEK